MNAEQVRRWLGLLGAREFDESGDWINTNCPLATWRHERGVDRSPSFGVMVEPGDSRVKCFSCNFGGTQTSLLRELRRLLGGDRHDIDFRRALEMIVDAEDGMEWEIDWEEHEATSDFLFSESWLGTFPHAYGEDDEGPYVHPYLEDRRMPYAVAELLDLRFMLSEQRVCFPIRNWGGDLVGLHGRSVLPDAELKYRMILYRGRKNSKAWLGESWIDTAKPVVFAESVFDLARVLEVYRNVACPLTASVGLEKALRMEPCDHIVTLFDPDRAGDQARERVEHVLGQYAIVEHAYLEDARDPGDLDPDEVADVLRPFVDLDEVLF